MRELDLKVQCPELLQQVPGFPNDGKGTALPDILFESECNQKALHEALGFAEGETTVEEEIATDFEAAFPFSKGIILSLLSKEDREYLEKNPASLWDNRLESGMKISKAITRRVADGSYLETFAKTLFSTESPVFFSKIRSELPKYPTDANAMYAILKDPSTFVQNFFSEIAAAKGKSIGFTLDPLMFLRGTNSPNYTSCYKIERHYNSMSAISLGLAGHIGMIYSKDGSSILGRCWVVFSPSFKSFTVLKSYGFLSRESKKIVCSWLCTFLNKDADWKFSDTSRFTTETNRGNVGIYNDPIEMVYSCNKIGEDRMGMSFAINTVVPKCIICGDRVQSNTIICNNCEHERMVRCASCGAHMLRDNEHTVQLCNKCISKVEVCPVCGGTYKKGGSCNCINKSPTCSFCGSPATLNFNSIALCTECAEAMVKTTCEACGAHGVMYPYKGKALCPVCFSAATTGRLENLRSHGGTGSVARSFIQNLR